MTIIGPIVVILIGALIVLPQTFFTVDETQLAIVTEFGEFQRSYTTPGLRTKTPFAQQVTRFDKRLLRVETEPASVLTGDKRNLVIDAYARYRIVEPLLFFQRLRDETSAGARVVDIVESELRREVALDLQEEVIGPKRAEIMDRITQATNLFEVDGQRALGLSGSLRAEGLTIRIITPESGTAARGRPPTAEELAELERQRAPATLGGVKVSYYVPLGQELGIVIVDVRIKRADFPVNIASSIYARMRAERERIASGLRAEGAQRDAEVRAEVDRDVEVLLETAQGESAKLRGEAEEEAIRILADSLEEDPEFYAFRRSLEAYKLSLQGDTTIVLDADSELFKYLQDPSAGR